jgi:hypothetical protein
MANQVTKKEDQLPADLLDEITATAGEGTSYDSSEMQIPFVRIIQALSPQIKKKYRRPIGRDHERYYQTVMS